MFSFILVLSDLFAYYACTNSDNKNNNFTLVLNKSGVNKIYFAEDSSKTPVTNNRHIFPLLGKDENGASNTYIEDDLYFFWELDDADGATITLKFLSSDSDENTGFMLDDVSSSSGKDFNYMVEVYSEDALAVKRIDVDSSSVLSALSLSERSMVVFSSGSKSTSYVKIHMKVLAPIWNSGENPVFMDAQYAGYIKAELKFT